jgi:hypothetical protein
MASASSSRCLGSPQRCVNCGAGPIIVQPLLHCNCSASSQPRLQRWRRSPLTVYRAHILAVLAERRFERAYQSLWLLKWYNSRYQERRCWHGSTSRRSGVDGETRTSRGLTMSISAISAGLLSVSLCVLEQTNEVFPICNVGGDYRHSSRGDVCSNRTAISLDFRRPSADDNFALKPVCRFISRLMLGHRFGAFRSPSGTRSSASHCAPLWGFGSSQNTIWTKEYRCDGWRNRVCSDSPYCST